MQKILRLIARLIVARHECTYVRHCKENAPIYMYYVLCSTGNAYMMTSIIADCPDLAPPNILDKSTPMIRVECVLHYTHASYIIIITQDTRYDKLCYNTNLYTIIHSF